MLEDQWIVVGADGRIEAMDQLEPPTADSLTRDELRLPSGWILLPGLIDTHLHAPQWPQRGTGLDLDLAAWLDAYTFPLEARFGDIHFARSVWRHMVPHLLGLGTTTAVYYGSLHLEATTALAETCIEFGQRAFVGRVAMDHPTMTPSGYRDSSAQDGLESSAASIASIESLADPLGLVAPIVTPRFIPACTDLLLAGLAELAEATHTRIQTHVAESDWEASHVLERCGRSDLEALDHFGLVQRHGVLAHGTHLSPAERNVIGQAGAGVAHCPLSNMYFSERVFPLAQTIGEGQPVGLGSDVAGGPDPSMLAQCGHAVTAGRLLADPALRVTTSAAFWAATVGGADLLGIPAGLLAPDRYFDAVAIDTEALGIQPEIDLPWAPERLLEKVVRLAGADAIKQVWVAGRPVKAPAPSPQP
jgi:guanine deaminase